MTMSEERLEKGKKDYHQTYYIFNISAIDPHCFRFLLIAMVYPSKKPGTIISGNNVYKVWH